LSSIGVSETEFSDLSSGIFFWLRESATAAAKDVGA
jgi:hypothetical protein